MTISRAIKEYLRFLTVSKGYSSHTLTNYRHYLSIFEKWATENKITEIEKVVGEDIEEFQLFLTSADPPKSAATKNYYLIALRAMLKYLLGRDVEVLSPDKIHLSKTPQRQVNFFESDEIERLRATIPSTLIGKRDRAIFSVLYASGLRISELVALKRNQVSTISGEFSVVGKGGKVRPVF